MPEGPDVRMTLNYIIDSSKSTFGDLGAIGMAMEQPITYEELHERVCALAASFMAKGLSKGDRVAILAENSHHWGTAYLSVVRFGGVGVPILPDLPEADVHHILGEMKVKAIFTTQRQIEKSTISEPNGRSSSSLSMTFRARRGCLQLKSSLNSWTLHWPTTGSGCTLEI